jgi:hypothetical protein
MSPTQSKIRTINKEVAQEENVSIQDVEDMTSSMWETLKAVIESNPVNALYLRFLGTFYGKESIASVIEEARRKKHGIG